MSALFFGPPGHQLFGFFHPAREPGRAAVLICPSWGPEYQYAHRPLRVLAKRLSENRLHVLRFDYSGTGDSAGDTSDADLDQWQEDVSLACRELQGLAGLRRIDMVGIRLGAAVAATAAARRSDVRRLVLWDPVTDGGGWSTGLNAPFPAGTGSSEPHREFAQRLVTDAFLDRIGRIGPEDYPPVTAEEVLVLRTTGEGGNPLPEGGAFSGAQQELVPDVPPWEEDASIWSGQVPARALRTLTDWLSR